MSKSFRRFLAAVAVVITALIVVGCGSSSSSSQQAAGSSGSKPKIALANSFIGNKWRIEMENVFKAACKMPPFTSVQCSVYNSNNDVSAQSQQISSLVSSGANAILVDAASATGLNGVIQQACAHNVMVIAFDNLVTAPCAIKINGSQWLYGVQNAQYIVNHLPGHKGNVIMVTGVAGTQADTDRNNGAMSVFKKYPGIKVVAKYTGMWDSATAQRNTASELPSLPKINAVWSSGGTDGILKAILAAGRPMPTVVGGEAENGYRRFMVGYHGQKLQYGLSLGQPPFNVLVAAEVAREVLDKQHAAPKGTVWLPFPAATQSTAKVGENVFTNVADSFFDAFTDSGPHAIVKICEQAALTGAACPGTMKVNVPWTYHPAGAQ